MGYQRPPCRRGDFRHLARNWNNMSKTWNMDSPEGKMAQHGFWGPFSCAWTIRSLFPCETILPLFGCFVFVSGQRPEIASSPGSHAHNPSCRGGHLMYAHTPARQTNHSCLRKLLAALTYHLSSLCQSVVASFIQSGFSGADETPSA